ncbi:hypothetical protein [Microvirga alba]|uniref:Uncharacterized protein n=1 Tax=Microvirga alba TaxID=2791025 RepID=A0A931BMV9_9HYPH|nr:hypothetical protein [Microvirga alba]MBF9234042.1 hypothetical protein [Microvirga alba]
MRAGKGIAWGIVLAALVVYAVMLTVTLPHLASLAGGVPVFDLRPTGYTLAEAKTVLMALGDEGRRYYLDVQQPLDTAFPILNAAAAAVGLTAAFSGGRWRLFQLGKGAHALLLAAICLPVAVFDLLENAMVRRLLTMDPRTISAEAVAMASGFTLAKSVAVTVAYCLVLVALMVLMSDRLRAKKARASRV